MRSDLGNLLKALGRLDEAKVKYSCILCTVLPVLLVHFLLFHFPSAFSFFSFDDLFIKALNLAETNLFLLTNQEKVTHSPPFRIIDCHALKNGTFAFLISQEFRAVSD